MNNALEGKVALVTGGGRGIGAAVAVRLAQDGADVALTFQHNQRRADEVVDQIRAAGRRAFAVRADSADPAAVVSAIDQVVGDLGRLDILVNNAGAFLLGPIEQRSLDEFERSVAVNVRAPFLASQAAVRHLPAGGGSSTSAATWPSARSSQAFPVRDEQGRADRPDQGART